MKALRASAELSRSEQSRITKTQRLASLTSREREVLELVLQGNTSQQIALRLSRAKRTVDLRRANVMKKMGAQSMLDLVQAAGSLALLSMTDRER